MSKLSNAQAALIAAASTDTTGDPDNVTYLASDYLKWLAAQDDAGPADQCSCHPGADHDERVPSVHVTKENHPVKLCARKSPSGQSLCDLPLFHGGKCQNEHEGVAWGGTGI